MTIPIMLSTTPSVTPPIERTIGTTNGSIFSLKSFSNSGCTLFWNPLGYIRFSELFQLIKNAQCHLGRTFNLPITLGGI